MKTLTTLLLLSFALLPTAAWATCASDADCAPDEVCLATPCACATPACDPEGECPEPEPCTCDAAAECVPTDSFDDDVYYSGDCEVDADCPMGFACEQVQVPCGSTRVDCACPGCAEGEECPPCECPEEPVEPPECEIETYGYCAYKPVECASDADCVEGFECKAQEVCSSSAGCGCAMPACDPDDGECPEPEPCECDETDYEETCEVIGNYCEAKQIECEAAADCPADWECVGIGADCACPAIACASDEPDACPDLPPCECAAEPTVSYCMPGGWAEAAARDYAAGSDDTGAVGEEQSPTAAFMEDASKAAAEQDATDTDKGSGCAYATTTTAGLGVLLLTVLSLLGVAVRRRRVTAR